VFLLDILSPRTWPITPVESTTRSCQVFGTSDSAAGAVNCSHRMSAMVCLQQPGRKSPSVCVAFYDAMAYYGYFRKALTLVAPEVACGRFREA
jgi:hypothetical protein